MGALFVQNPRVVCGLFVATAVLVWLTLDPPGTQRTRAVPQPTTTKKDTGGDNLQRVSLGDNLNPPHGGSLVNLIASPARQDEVRAGC